MFILLVFLYVICCLFLIAVVLLQTGKRADLAGAFGGGGSQTAFGTRGAANLLTRLTTVSAVAFMVLALTLTMLYRGGGSGGSVLEDVDPSTGAAVETTEPAPAPTEDQPAGTLPPAEEPAGGTDDTPPEEGSAP